MCSIDSADPCDVYHVEQRRAAKDHHCYECGNQISIGTVHKVVTMLYDRQWTTARLCAHCVAAGRWLDLVCGGYLIGGLHEELSEHWNEDPIYRSHWLGRAIIGMQRRWRGMDPLPDPKPMLERRRVTLS